MMTEDPRLERKPSDCKKLRSIRSLSTPQNACAQQTIESSPFPTNCIHGNIMPPTATPASYPTDRPTQPLTKLPVSVYRLMSLHKKERKKEKQAFELLCRGRLATQTEVSVQPTRGASLPRVALQISKPKTHTHRE